MQQPQNQGGGGTDSEIRSDAKKIGNSAANRLYSEADARKNSAAGQAKSVSSAFERAAGEMDDNTPNWLKSALRQGADQIQRFADSIEQKDSRQLMSEAQDFARNNPGTFLAACAATGFAAARVFKAGGEQQDGQRSRQGQQFGRDQQSSHEPQWDRPTDDASSFGSTTSRTGSRARTPGEVV